MASKVKTWARLRCPIGTEGTGGSTIMTASGGETYNNVVFSGAIYLSTELTMVRTYFNPFWSSAVIRYPYFTANSPFSGTLGNFGEWTAMQTSGSSTDQTLTDEDKDELIGQTVTFDDASTLTITSGAFDYGQSHASGIYIASIGNLTQI